MNCIFCNHEIEEQSGICPFCKNSLSDDPSLNNEKNQSKAKKKKFKLPFIIITALVVVIAIVGAYLFNVFNSPLYQIAKAYENTYEAGNLSADFKILSEEKDYKINLEGTLESSWDIDNRDISYYLEFTVKNHPSKETHDSYVAEIEIRMALLDGEIVACVKRILSTNSESIKYYYEDISTTLNKAFAAYEDNKNKEFDDMVTEEFITDLLGEKVCEQITDEIDLNNLKKCVKSYIKQINSSKWLKNNMGMETEEIDNITHYTFQPNARNIAKSTLEEFEKAFKYKDTYDKIKSTVLDKADDFDADFDTLKFGIGLSDSLITKATLSIETDEQKIECDSTMYDFGSTKIDTNKIEDLISTAKDNC